MQVSLRHDIVWVVAKFSLEYLQSQWKLFFKGFESWSIDRFGSERGFEEVDLVLKLTFLKVAAGVEICSFSSGCDLQIVYF